MIRSILVVTHLLLSCQPSGREQRLDADQPVSEKVTIAFNATWPDATNEDGYRLHIVVNNESEYGFPVSKGSRGISGQVPVGGAEKDVELLARLFSADSELIAEVTMLYHTLSGLSVTHASQAPSVPLRLKVVPAGMSAPSPTEPTARLRDVEFELSLQFLEPDSTEPAITYGDIKPLIDQHCVRCHMPVARGGGIDLSNFPFVHAIRNESQRQLAERVLSRMRDPNYPMPPGEPRPAEEISHIQQWVDQGLEGDLNGGNRPNPNAVATQLRASYRAQELQGVESVLTTTIAAGEVPTDLLIPGLLSGAVYELRFEFLNANGDVVGTVFRELKVPADGVAELALSCGCFKN